ERALRIGEQLGRVLVVARIPAAARAVDRRIEEARLHGERTLRLLSPGDIGDRTLGRAEVFDAGRLERRCTRGCRRAHLAQWEPRERHASPGAGYRNRPYKRIFSRS